MGQGVLVNLRHVYFDPDRHGNPRFYFWRGKGHRKIRIREQPGTDAFRKAYDAAAELDTDTLISAEPPAAEPGDVAADGRPIPSLPKRGTYRWLCSRYMAECSEYLQMGDRTRHVRKQILEHTWQEPTKPGAKTTFGDMPLDRFDIAAVYVLRDRKATLPEAANSRVKALRQVLAWATQPNIALMKSNFARDIPYFKGKGEGFHTWTIEEVRQFAKRHPIGTKAHLALGLLLFTGVRRSDVIKLGRQMRRDGWLHFTEFKGRERKPKVRQLPMLPVLDRIVEASNLGNLTFLVTEFDRPFTPDGFGNWFRDRCVEAGVPGRAHGLRKAGATIAAENGATEHMLMSIYGWESPKQAALYTKKARRKKLAQAGMRYLDLGDLDGVEDLDIVEEEAVDEDEA
jgi:integrase